jgi:transcriptional regulator with XRE-family HTH domain
VSYPKQSADRQALGRVIRSIRRQRDWSQEALGLFADVQRTYVSAIERGASNPSFVVVLKLAKALGMPLSRLIAEVEALRPTD